MRLAERYELGERVGSGGMGVVHRARDLATGETVAVKVLHHAGPDSRRRFAREAQALAQLSHEGVVRYVDSGADAEGRPFLVMEWLEGETLEERLARGPLGWPEVAGLARRLADALSALHARRIVHRDVKPTNVFLVGGEIDRAKLLDLGVAHVAMTSLALTRTGSIVGTPDYMSPEQARADRGIGPSADVFSLGCVLYHCLTGEPPFAGTRVVAVLAKILFSEPAPLAERVPEAPPALRELVERMLVKEPAERPEDGRALCAALRALPLEPSAPRTPSAPASLRPRIGDEESQVVSVVLSSALGGEPAAASSGVASREELATAIDARPQVVALLEGTLGATVHALAHGGLVATVAGTGSPVDRVASACRVALRMHDAMPDASIVIATGRGVLRERAPVGRVIEQAAARLDRVRPGVIGIDEATASLLDARFTLAGDEGTLELAGERSRSDGVRRFLGHETQMVGRARELRVLEGLVAQCVEDAASRAALVVAPPGLGKSRLRYELLRRARERWPSLSVWIGWGDPLRADSPFALLAEAVRRELDLGEGDTPSLSRARIRARAGRAFGGARQDEIAAYLGEMLGVPFDDAGDAALRAARGDPELMRHRIREAFEAWLSAEAAERPVMIVLEDAHACDAASLELIGGALDALPDRPLFVLALGHPEVRERAAGALGRRGLDVIALRELSPKAAEQLARAELPGATEEIVARVVGLAEGNPLYLEELIRAVASGSAELPDSVTGMVQARLDALAPELRRAMRAASVVGEVFWTGAVAALIDLPEPEAAALVRAMEAAELCDARPASRVAGEREHVFRHALVHQTAYASLTPEDRELGHRLAARWLERAGEHDAMAIAEHHDRGGDAEAAALWLGRAAAQSLAASDVRAARARAERGLERASSPAQRAPLALVLAEVERWAGRFDRALEHALCALPVLPEGTREHLRALSEAITASGRLGDHAEVERLAAEAERVVAGSPLAASAQASCLAAAARFLFHAGRYAAALARIEHVEGLLRAHGEALDAIAVAEIHRVRAARARQFGDPAGDAEGYLAALAAYERAGDARSACNARVSVGFALAELGELDRAEGELRRALAEAERMQLWPIATRAVHNLGLVMAEKGALEEAQALEERAVAESCAQEDARLEGGSRVYLSMITLRRGDLERSGREARAAASCFVTMPPARAGALAAEARALVAASRASEALPLAEDAMRTLEALGGVEEYESMIRLAHVEALLGLGREAEARSALGAASARLAARAAFVTDPAARRRFLQNDSDNAALVRLAREHGAWSEALA